MKYQDFKFCLDVETSCLYAKKEENGIIIPTGNMTEVAIIVLDHNLEEVDRYYSKRIYPYADQSFVEWNYKAAEVTGITQAICLAEGRPAEEVYTEIANLAKKYKNGRWVYPQIIAYNAPFDLSYLETFFDYFEGNKMRKPNGSSILYKYFNPQSECVMKMARDKFGMEELPNFQLPTMVEYLGIKTNNHFHGAMADTEVMVVMYKYFLECLRGNNESGVKNTEKSKFNFQF